VIRAIVHTARLEIQGARVPESADAAILSRAISAISAPPT
jgi:hypothetical protein